MTEFGVTKMSVNLKVETPEKKRATEETLSLKISLIQILG